LNTDFATDATSASNTAHTLSAVIFLERLLDLLLPEDLNVARKSINENLDVILSTQNGRYLPKVCDLIMRLVERGGRIRSKDSHQRSDPKYDPQALEIYYDAVRGIQQKKVYVEQHI
jgi:hypothetical protein